ncbi:MAG: YhfC family glutamic-type intramembrane protease [Chloroflexota bacterium]
MKASTIFAFILALIIQVGLPLAITLHFRRKTRAPWTAFFCGVLVYGVFQLFTWLPLSVYVDAVVGATLPSGTWAFVWLLALALTTSLVEEFGRWCGYRFLFRRVGLSLTWRHGVMFGLGHGAVETMLLIGGLTFMHLLAYIALARADLDAVLPPATGAGASAFAESLRAIQTTTWTQPLTVAFERILALAHQVAWALLVMASLGQRQKRWFGFAVLYHASVAVIVPGLARLAGFAVAEAVNLLLAAFSFWIILKLRPLAPEEGR